MARELKQKKNRTHPFLWFLFVIVIPVIVAMSIAIIVMTMAGINVADWAKESASKIPVISSFVSVDQDDSENLEVQLATAEAIVDEQAIEIDNMRQQIADLEATIDRLERERARLTEVQQTEESASAELAEERQQRIKQLSASFRKMDQEQAALIFTDLNDDIAIALFEQLSNDVRGNILEAMDPKEAARLTEKMYQYVQE